MNVEEMLRGWLVSLTLLHRGHWQAARFYEGRNLLLGMAAAVTAAVAGTTVFATLGDSPNLAVRIGIGCFGVIAAILSGLQTFLRSSQLAELHKSAAVKYGGLRREVEQEIAFGAANPAAPEHFSEFRSRWDAVDSEAPPVPSGIYQRTVRNFARRAGGREGANGAHEERGGPGADA